MEQQDTDLDLDALSLQHARAIWEQMNENDRRAVAAEGAEGSREGIASWSMWVEDEVLSSLSDEEQRQVLDGILDYLKMLGSTVGFWARDRFDGMGLHYPDAASAEAAVKQYLEDGEWGEVERPTRLVARGWRYVLTEDGELEEADEARATHVLLPEPPECAGECSHEWCSPVEVVGGLDENPGVFGHGGGVIIKEVCRHCGTYRVTDTWYQDPDTGEVWNEDAVWFEAPDEVSESWVKKCAWRISKTSCNRCTK